MKHIVLGIVAFVMTIALLGGVIVGGGVAPGNTSETILTIRHAAIGAQGTVRLVSPDGMYLLASHVNNNWGFVALSGAKDCLWCYASLSKAANMVSPLTWGNLYQSLIADGWKEITAAQLPQGIKNIAAAPKFDSFLKWFVASMNGLGAAGASAKLRRKGAK